MKKIITFVLLFLFFSNQNIAQTVQASLGLGTATNRVKIYIQSNTTLTTNISTLEFNIAVPVSETVSTPTVVSSANSITWQVDNVHTEGGYNNFAITTGVIPIVFNLTAKTEFEVLELEFPGSIILPDSVSLITLPDGGTNGLYLFYCTGNPTSDGSNLYYSRSGTAYNTTINNGFSYDASGNSTGTDISNATLINVATPVKLSSFNVTNTSNNAVLSWAVENQDATSNHFEIERSANGTNFSPIGTVDATSESKASYSYTDENINLSGTVYYRIKMVDKDGQFDFSDVKSIRLNNVIFSASVYPNPVSTSSKLSIELNQAQTIKVSINDALGNLVKQIQITGQKGVNEKTLDLSSIPSGSYIIRIQAGQNLKTIPIIKN